jgi:hypothetical protein
MANRDYPAVAALADDAFIMAGEEALSSNSGRCWTASPR